ncbi:MAG TPA: hypothetical protein VM621_01950 [Luteibacter sp.]|uniref:hypothetical protein n=1 Tax=Luteibacter sp. TaxID=1886636 RepID=UPI002BEF5AC4|nr:hypothetical protein [Luteibacter sp.]HVI53798.1 hypothetical protein [Luteibacter sp.]
MRISFTKIMCSILAFFALSSSAFALVSLGYHWARWIVFMSISTAVWIGLPSAVLVMLRKLDDDRGDRKAYSHSEYAGRKIDDRLYVIYPVCTSVLAIAALAIWIGCVAAYVIAQPVHGTFALSDSGRPLTRNQAMQMVIFCTGISSILSLGMGYLQRGKGDVLVKASLLCGAAYLTLGLILTTYLVWVREAAS